MIFPDALSLLDKVLLHEMTHGRMAFSDYHVSDGYEKEFEGTQDVGFRLKGGEYPARTTMS
jgi:hypothetical protein